MKCSVDESVPVSAWEGKGMSFHAHQMLGRKKCRENRRAKRVEGVGKRLEERRDMNPAQRRLLYCTEDQGSRRRPRPGQAGQGGDEFQSQRGAPGNGRQ